MTERDLSRPVVFTLCCESLKFKREVYPSTRQIVFPFNHWCTLQTTISLLRERSTVAQNVTSCTKTLPTLTWRLCTLLTTPVNNSHIQDTEYVCMEHKESKPATGTPLLKSLGPTFMFMFFVLSSNNVSAHLYVK